MNKIYSKVWNKELGQLVVASELASSDTVGVVADGGMGRAVPRLATLMLALTALPAALGVPQPAMAAAIFINNTATGGPCGYVNYDSSSTTTGSTGSGDTRCNSSDTQNSTALFYNNGTSGDANNLSLGGRLSVNTGSLALGGGTTNPGGGASSMRIGSTATVAATGTGARSLAIGGDTVATKATGIDSIAMGSQALSSGISATAVGSKASAGATGAVAVGSNYDAGPATGAGAAASAVNAIAIGGQSSVNSAATSGIAIGRGANLSAAALYGIAQGDGATVSGDSGIGIGKSASASSTNAVALGVSAAASSTGTVALGTSAAASSTNALALGANTSASGAGAMAMGSNATAGANAGATDSVAIGGQSVVNAAATSGIAVGHNARVNAAAATFGIAVGEGAVTNGSAATAIGRLASAGGTNAVSLGNGAGASNTNTIALGTSAAASATGAVALGSNGTGASAAATDAIAIGGQSKVISGATSGIAIGRGANLTASASLGIAAGDGAQSGAANAVAIGKSTTAAGAGATALGANALGGATASATDAIAIGGESSVSGTSASGIAVGRGASVTGGFGIAQGDSAQAAASGVAIGKGAKATGAQSISIGTGNTVSGNNSGAIGDPTTITGSGTYTVGNNNGTVAADESGIFGNNNTMSTAGVTGSRIVGNNSSIAVSDAFVLGNSASVTTAGGVAIGSNSVASTAAGVAGYDPVTQLASTNTSATWKSTLAAVSVGNGTTATRQITGVAAGTAATDAVNVAQLQSVVTGGGGIKYFHANSTGADSSASGTGSIAIGGNLAAGASAAATNSIALGGQSSVNATATSGIAIGRGANVAAAATNSAAMGDGASAGGMLSTAIGSSATTVNTYAVSVGSGAGQFATDGFASVSVGSSAGQSTAGGMNTAIGSQNAGAQMMGDANVSVGQAANFRTQGTGTTGVGAYAGQNSVGSYNTSVGFQSGRTVTGANNVAIGLNAGNGITASDTISIGTSAAASKANALAIGNGATATGTQSISIGTGNTVSGNNSGAIGDPTIITGGGTYTIGNNNGTVAADESGIFGNNNNLSTAGVTGSRIVGNNSSITASNGFALGNNASVTATGGVAIGSDSEASTAAGIPGYDPATRTSSINFGDASWTSTHGAVSVGGTNATRQITGVAAGSQITDAVNVGQLQSLASTGWKISDNSNTTTVMLGDTVAFQNTDGNLQIVNNPPQGMFFELSDDINVTSVTAGNSKLDTSGLVITGGPSVTTAGIDAANTVIANVTAGTAATDAVNVAQLEASSTHYYNVNDGGMAGGNYANDGATGIYSVAAGVDAEASSFASIAQGYATSATADSAIAQGSYAKASGLNAVAIGDHANATADDGVALGSQSVASTAAGVAGYDPLTGAASTDASPAWLSTAGAVSVGRADVGITRQITSVAAGTQDTDAVNLAQLKAVSTTAGAGWNVTDGTTAANIGPNGTVTFDGDANITVEQAGTDDAGQVNVTLNRDLDVDSITAGNSSLDNNGLTVSNGTTTTATTATGVTITDGAATTTLGATGLSTGTVLVSGSNNTINGLSNTTFDPAAITSGQAATEDQLAVVANTANGASDRAVKYNWTDANADGLVDPGEVDYTQATLAGAGGTKLTNVAAAAVNATSADAVNGSQLFGVSQSVATNLGGGSVVNPDGTISAPSYVVGGATYTDIGSALAGAGSGWDISAQGANATNVAPGETVDLGNTDGNIVVGKTATADDVTFDLADDIAVNSVTAGNTILSTSGLTVTDGTTTTAISATGLTTGNVVISGVSNTITGLSNTAFDPAAITSGQAATEDQLKSVSDTLSSTGWTVSDGTTSNTVALGDTVTMTNTDGNVEVTNDGTSGLTFDLADDIDVASVTAGASKLDNTGLVITGGPSVTTAGIDANGLQITKLASAGDITDPLNANNAVNAGDLNSAVGSATSAGLDFAGNDATAGVVHRDLGEALMIAGSATTAGTYSGNNLKTVTDPTTGAINLQMADAPQFGSVVVNSGNAGTINGLSNTTFDPAAITSGQAATEDQLKSVSDTLSSTGWTVSDGINSNTVALGDTVTMTSNDDNVVVTNDGTSNLTFDLANDVAIVNSVTVGQSVLGLTGLTVDDGTTTTATTATGVTISDGSATTSLGLTGLSTGAIVVSGATNTINGLSNTTFDPAAITSGQAATEDQLKSISDTLSSTGWTVSDGTTSNTVALGSTVTLTSGDGDVVVTNDGASDLKFELADDIEVASVTAGNSKLDTTGLTITGGPSMTTAGIDAGGLQITNLASAGDITDPLNANNAVNAGDLKNAVTSATSTGLDFAGNDVTAGVVHRDLGQALTIAGGASTGGTYSGNNLKTVTDPVTGAINLQMADAPQFGSVVVNTGNAGTITGLSNTTFDPAAITSGQAATEDQLKSVSDTLSSTGWTVSDGTTSNTVALGGTVALTSTDGDIEVTNDGNSNLTFNLADDVEVASVTAGNSKLDTSGLTVDDGADSAVYGSTGMTIANGPSVTTAGINAGNLVITNVAAGAVNATSTDAVNGSQLFAVAGDTSTTYITNNGKGTRYARTNDTGLTEDDAHATVGGATAVGYNATASHDQSVAIGRDSLADGSTLGAAAYNPGTGTLAGTAPVGEVSIGNAGAERRITNVAAGANAADAVNVSQLQAVSDTLSSTGWVISDGTTSNTVALGSTVTLTNGDGDVEVTNDGASGLTFELADDIEVASVTAGNSVLDTNGLAIDDGAGSVSSYTASGTSVTNGTMTATTSAAGMSITDGSAITSLGLTGLSTGTIVVSGTSNTINGLSNTTFDPTNFASGQAATEDQLGWVVNSGHGIKYFHTNSATGGDSKAGGDNSLAIGPDAETGAAATDAIAIGNGAKAVGASSISIGTGNVVSGNNSGAIGDPSYINADDAYAIGNNNTINAQKAFVLGNNVSVAAGLDGAVVLGDGSNVSAATPTTSGVVGGTTYTYAGGAPMAGGVVSVGAAGAERQIQNVAAGRVDANSTDAVNGSQLFATNQKVDQNTTDITNIVSNGTGIKYFHANSIGGDSSANGSDSVAIGPSAVTGATATNAIAIGNGAVANDAGSVALGAGSATAPVVATTDGTVGGTAYTYAGGAPVGTVSVGTAGAERTLTNVAAGRVSATSTDAVNGSQLFATNQKVDQNTADITTINTTLTNITNGSGIKYFHTNSMGADGTAAGADSVAIGPSAAANNANSMAMGNGATANHDNSVALGAGSATTVGAQTGYNAAYVGSSNSTGEMNVGGRQITGVAAGSAATDAVNVSQLNAGVNQAISTAKSYTDTQISIVNTSITSLDNRVTSVEGDVANLSSSVTNLDNRVTTVEGDLAELQNGTVGMFQVSQGSTGSPTPTGANSIAGGAGANASAANATALGNQSTASAAGSTALGTGATASGSNSVAIGAGSVASASNTVSVGAVGSERTVSNVAAGVNDTDAVNVAQLKGYSGGAQYDKNPDGTVNYYSLTLKGGAAGGTTIHNVAAGTASTDAVNVGQLQAGLSSTLSQATRYTDGRVQQLQNDMWTMDRGYRGATASAMAMAGLPQVYVPGKSMFSVGMGGYQGEYGMAVGLSGITDNGQWVYKGQLSGNTTRDWGFSVGAGIQW
ncbi:ESPR-type extended signal peptide-containing protein [Lysobacter niastensis]|uniref:Uncharacterized protein n=1 Tax=Lysobacter niastensis TaxID=380629 RepID=A0ABS0B7J9_9GAMM|nr:ESPR-type extended signal peptide-containing protein [Lysobacter niastensis]MBF6025000.1 hypothetical protein [Lysobacter niastensis]